MRIRYLGSLVIGLFLLAGVLPAQAQFNFTLNVPFAFQVEDKQFPAGAYVFKQTAADQKFGIHAQKGDLSGMFGLTYASDENPLEKDRTVLTFHRYGDKYFLAGVFSRHKEWVMGTSAAEKELQNSGKAMVEIKLNMKM